MLSLPRYRAALITGAGSGLGAAFTEMLLAQGIPVWGTSRTPEKLLPRAGFTPLRLELSDAASIDDAWSTAEGASGGVDLVINNAGSAAFGPVVAASSDDFERQMDLLLRGPMRLTWHAYAAMRQRAHGSIVNVTSMAVEFPLPFLAAYNSAKAGLAAFTGSLALEAPAHGIVVIDFRPGDYRTNFDFGPVGPPVAAACDGQVSKVRQRLESMVANGPPPARAARDLARALRRGRSGVVRSGSFFQTRIAPGGKRLLPAAVMRWVQDRYFRMP